MDKIKKEKRYQRIINQLENLFKKTKDFEARMATAIAILHHKFDYFFWTGYYRLVNGELTVASYQGSVACLVLQQHVGVCWSAIDKNEIVIVPNVNEFPGHIACDSRSNSEICVPLRDSEGLPFGVFDVDSREFDSFDEIDGIYLEKIIDLVINNE